MKRITILLLTVLTFASCGDEVEFNSPGMRANKDYVLWKAEYFNAAVDSNGFLTITGGRNVETLQLKIPSVAVGTYKLNIVESMSATFTAADGTIFSTDNRPHPSVTLYDEVGEIVLEEIFNNTFTGTFHFNAYDETGLRVVNFSGTTENDPVTGGLFFRVPLTSGSIPSVIITCVDTIEPVALAEAAFEATTADDLIYVNSEDYMTACLNLVDALRDQITYCNDPNGALTIRVNNMLPCEFPCELAEENRNIAEASEENATIGNYILACTDYQFYLQEQIDFCGDEDGSIQMELDSLNCGDDDGDGIPNAFEDFNGDGVFDDDTDMDGIPNIMDDDDDGDGVLTIHEAKDADGNPLDTDGDGNVDYLDSDDDGDGLLTANENADPNMDGNPVDAVDTDMDGIPDYLDDM